MTETSLIESKEISPSYDPKEIEEKTRQQWDTLDLRKKISERLHGKKRLGYIEGPPTLNGEPHIGHVRGRLMKDTWYRFETERGNFIDFRGGWDCQGLPVELQAEKELGLTGNKTANLKLIGEEKLVQACKNMVKKYHEVWKDTDRLLGLLMNDEKAYWTFYDSYIEREWQILKSAWENRILDEAFRVTPFCPSCQTPLSAGEVALGGYETLDDPSMYFKMRLVNEKNTYLIAWTTMPFTVVTDELVGAKPDAEYCYIIPSAKKDEVWLVGSERLDALMKELKVEAYQVLKRVKGSQLEGVRYEYPMLESVPKQKEFDVQSQNVHSIVAEEFVDTTTGSGLVHMAPANGEDDFEVASKRKVPVFNPIDGQAQFTIEAGEFAGLFVRDADLKVKESLDKKGLLLRYGKLKHEYPVCWRSGHRLVWLARREYYYFVDRLDNKALDAAKNVDYFYEQPSNRFLEIIKEKRPWCISRERVWGAPLPIWKCPSCGEKLGLFSRKEIVDHAKSLPDGSNFELHRPWIDRVGISCPKCKAEMNREPFVLDTWHNSGAAPYASLSDHEYEEYIPVPYLTEGIDQTRGWAYTLLIENVILRRKGIAPYASFLFQGHVLDEKGQKMSKSKGNYIPAKVLLSEQSVDLVRLYLSWKGSPIDSVNFGMKELSTRPYQILNTLYHMHLFYLQNSTFDQFSLNEKEANKKLDAVKDNLRKQDRWILSRLGFLIDFSTEAYATARYHDAARAIEQFLIEDLSQGYVPIVRSEMWQESDEGKKRRSTIYAVLGYCLLKCNLVLHPISPYVTDYLARAAFDVPALTLEDWPSSSPSFRNQELEVEFDLLSKLVSLTNAARMKAKTKRRWPLRNAFYLVSKDSKEAVLSNKDLLLEQTNLKSMSLSDDPASTPIKLSAKLNRETVAPVAKEKLSQIERNFAQTDPLKVYNDLAEKGRFKIDDFDLRAQDIQFDFFSADPNYSVSTNYGMVVALDVSRDEELISEGLLRDVARNLQAMRKEKQFSPTDLLERASVAGLGTQFAKMLEPKREELAFLVRVKQVNIYSDLPEESASWESADLEGSKIKLEIH
ncbi:MAG: isoleucine--tRNA ligase [Nitrososphaerales archaeon]